MANSLITPTLVLAAVPWLLALPASAQGNLQNRERSWTKDEVYDAPSAKRWSKEVPGWTFYLRDPHFPLLVNDRVKVVRCSINRMSRPHRIIHGAYWANLRLTGIAPAPERTIKIETKPFKSLEDLRAQLGVTFSETPLEDAFDWPPAMKRAVRNRVIRLGMDDEMVKLVLGGWRPDIDFERLDDGRIRETWKLPFKGDTRRVFTSRTAALKTAGSGKIEAPDVLGNSKTSFESTGEFRETGFSLFSGLPPQFLHIIFTDGKVTGRKTEFVK